MSTVASVDGPSTGYVYEYKRPALTVDLIVTQTVDRRPHVLLIRRLKDPFQGSWALPGGFVDETDANAVQAALRELLEETHVAMDADRLRQIRAFTDRDRDPRGWTVSLPFLVHLAPDETVRPRAGDDAAEVRFWPLDALPPLAFDHAEMLQVALAC